MLISLAEKLPDDQWGDAALDSKDGHYDAEEGAWVVYCETLMGHKPIPQLACHSILLRAEQTMDYMVDVWEHLGGKKMPRLALAQSREEAIGVASDYDHLKHPKADLPKWMGELDPTDDLPWAAEDIDEDLPLRAKQSWLIDEEICSEIHARTGDGEPTAAAHFSEVLIADSVYIVYFAHANINRQKAHFAIDEEQGFARGSRLTIETSVAEDGSRTRR